MADQVEAKAKITVTADTKQAVQSVSGLQKSLAAVGEEAKKTKSSFTDTVSAVASGFAKFGLAANGVSMAFDAIGKGLDTAFTVERRRNMEALIGPGTVDRLRDSIGNLIPRTQVLGVAVKAMTGDFKLTEQEMTTVLKAAIALEQKGFGPAAEVAERLNDALVNGVNRLDDFGIDLEKTKDRQGDVNLAMGKFNDLIRDTPIDKQAASLRTLRDDLTSVGEAIQGMVAAAASGIADIYDAVRNPGNGGDGLSDWMMDLVYGQEFVGNMSKRRRGLAPKTYQAHQSISADGQRELEIEARERAQMEANEQAANEQFNAYQRRYGLGDYQRAPGVGTQQSTIRGEGETGQLGAWASGPSQAEMGGVGQFRNASQYISELGDEASQLATAISPAEAAMLRLADSGTAVGMAFQGGMDVLQAGVAAAVGAAIDGSDSIGAAFAKASAAALKSLAIEYAVRAVGSGAFALASLAYGDARGAATHGAAAAKFAAAAAVAGAGSAALGAIVGSGGGGGSASSSVAGGSAGSYSAGSGAGGGGGGNNITINFGDGFVGDRKQVESLVNRAVRSANRRGSRSSDSYATSYE